MNRRYRILVVDDEESIRIGFKRFLTDMGFDVEVASNVEDAKAVLSEMQFDVAIIDNTFPQRQSGMELVAYLNSSLPFCKSVLISGYPIFQSQEEITDSGVFAFLFTGLKRKANTPESVISS